jgi:hypothetical protein
MSNFDDIVRQTLDMVKKSQDAKGADAANALQSSDWNAKLNRIAEKEKLDATLRTNQMANDKALTLEQMKTNRQEDINQRYLDVQQLKNDAGGVGGSSSGLRKDGKVNDAELYKLAVEHSKANAGLPGKPDTGIGFPAALKMMKDARDGTPAEKAAATAALQASQVAIPATPTALTTKDWNAYGKNYADQQTQAGRTDVQAPMKFQGLQPGMQGDQIGRFTKADGSVHFANTSAVQNAVPAPITTPVEPTVNRDAGLRSAPAPVSTLTPKSIVNPTEPTSSVDPTTGLISDAIPPVPKVPVPRGPETIGSRFVQNLQGIPNNSDFTPAPTAMDNLNKASQGVPGSGFIPPENKPGFLDWINEKRGMGPDELRARELRRNRRIVLQ